MSQPDPVADYLDVLASELSFDRTLARRVRIEVEDHLWEAAAHPGGPSLENQRRVIAEFGDPTELAASYVSASLLAQVRRAAGATLLAVIAIFVAMEARIAWYGLVEWKPDPYWLTAWGLWLDRYAFTFALIIALTGCFYAATRRAPPYLQKGYSRELSHCIALCAATAAALLVTVLTETTLTGVRLFGRGLRWEILIPVGSLAAEIAAAVVLIWQIRDMVRKKIAAGHPRSIVNA
jgi:HAAS domain-containing protein